jgi:hypothetical protein
MEVISKVDLKNCPQNFFLPFERLFLNFSAIFSHCTITRQLIV